MRTTDTATQASSSPETQIVESTQVLPAIKDNRLSRPLSSETPYAVRLLTITSTVGLGAVLLGQGLWQPDTKAARLPAPEEMVMNRNSLPSLRDRVTVTTLKSSVSPPESLPSFPISAARQKQSAPSTDLPTDRISHGFGNAEQPPLATALPVPVPVQTLPQTLPSIAVEPQVAPAPKQAPTQQADRPPAVIASLLEPPRPRALAPQTADPQAASTIAMPPRPKSPAEQVTSERKQSQAIPTQAALISVRDTVEQAPSTGLPTLSMTSSMPIASTIQPTALEPTRPSLEDTDISESFTLTGNTRFSSKELVEVVQQAIAAKAGESINRQLTANRSFSPTELLQASAVITQFYAAHGYTNVKVYVPADGLNSATPKIQIVENTLEPSIPVH